MLTGTAPTVELHVGNTIPDITLKSIDRDTQFALSALRGHLVLVDFWASWCPPCRSFNPSLVKLYKQYQNRSFKNAEGFTVYSISLDRTLTDWKKAIEQDELVWPYHVSDLKAWASPVIPTFGVDGIPMSYLVDEKGKIILVKPTINQLRYALARRAQATH